MRKNKWQCLALSCLLAAIPKSGYSQAEEEGLESLLFMEIPVATVAAISTQKLDEVPGTVTVITHEDIKYMGVQSLLEVFNMVPGFSTLNATSYGSSTLYVRRYNYAYANAKIMIDGHPVNSPYYRDILSWQYMPMDNVKQIEIIRGPGSCLYGTDALSTVVNIVTDKSKRCNMSAQFGEHNRQGYGAAHYSDPAQDFSYSASVDYFQEDGDELTYAKSWLQGLPFGNNNNTRELKKERLGAHLGAKYKNLEFTLRHSDNDRAWTEGYVNIQEPGDEWVYSGMTYAELADRIDLSDTSSLQWKVSYDRDYIEYEGLLFPPGFNWLYIYGIPDINFDGVADNWPAGGQYDSRVETDRTTVSAIYQTQAGNHGLSFGAEYGLESMGDVYTKADFHNTFLTKVPLQKYTVDGPIIMGVSPVFNVGEGQDEGHWGAFAQDIWKMSDSLSTVLGVRHDNYQDAGGTTSPRIAFVWNGIAEQIYKISYGEAFRAPTNSEKYTTTFGYFGTPGLKPEIMKTLDFSIQNSFEKVFHYVITLYSSKLYDHVIRDSSRRPSYFNTAGDKYQGVEVEGRWKAAEKLFVWGNFSYDGDESDSGLVDDYQSMFKLGFTSFLTDTVALSAFTNHVGSTDRAEAFNRTETDAYTTVNLTLMYSEIPNLDLALIGKNVLDEDYAYFNEIRSVLGRVSSDYPAEGRQVVLKGTYHWG